MNYKEIKEEKNNLVKNLKELGNEYITTSKVINLKEKYKMAHKCIKSNVFFKILFYSFIRKYKSLEKTILIKNDKFIIEENKRYNDFFNNICGYPLDQNQRNSIIIDDDKNLVVAGAGSGKSLTMIGKIHYLIKAKNIKERDILCISFTNETTKSLKNKLKKIYNYNIDVYTFHKLGYQIIKNTNPNVTIANENVLEICIEEYFNSKEKEQIYKIFDYFNEFTKIPKEYKVKDKFITLKSMCLNTEEKVRSEEEVVISNILYLKGINYKYESTSYGCIFHLEKEDIHYYNFNNPLYTLKLLKKNTHINIYKYNFHEKEFTNIVENILKRYNIKSFPLDKNKIYKDMLENKNDYIESLKKLIVTFMNIFKSSTKTLEEIETTVKKNTIECVFISVFKEIYTIYQNKLRSKNEIDINDMLLLATEMINEKYTYKQYKYILIDEFQDTSQVRYALIHNIIKHTKAKLVAVGDDFQSIYRFSGCDVNLFINFERYFGKANISYIENTYRNSQKLIDIAGAFVMKNPSQIKKKLYSNKHIDKPIEIHYYDNLSTELLKIIKKLSTGKDKIILGRNNKDIEMIENEDINISSNFIYVKSLKEKIPYLTVHKSKGLEYDYVFLINMTDDITGFPSKLEEHKILKLVLPKEEDYPYAEERRLFYVALTRAKEKVFILSPKQNPSVFVKELEDMLVLNYKN